MEQRKARRHKEQRITHALDWDLWIGPVTMVPYNKAYCPAEWWGWNEFGLEALGDWACHNMEKKNLKAWYFHLLTDFTTGISLNIFFAGNHYQNGQIGFMGALNNSFVFTSDKFYGDY